MPIFRFERLDKPIARIACSFAGWRAKLNRHSGRA
jgi:hypothetical protein